MAEPKFKILGPGDSGLCRTVCVIHGRLPAEWGEDEPVSPELTESSVDQLEKGIRDGRAYCEIATTGDEIVAFMWSEIPKKAPDVVNIISLWTHPDHRRQGLAKCLKIRMERWARNLGAKRILTGVDPRNTAVVEMNERMGYRIAMLRMEKEL